MAEANTPEEVVHVEIRPGLTNKVVAEFYRVPPEHETQAAPFKKAPA